jgi:hypothetical protein
VVTRVAGELRVDEVDDEHDAVSLAERIVPDLVLERVVKDLRAQLRPAQPQLKPPRLAPGPCYCTRGVTCSPQTRISPSAQRSSCPATRKPAPGGVT